MKIESIDSSGIIFDNGTKIEHQHSQDCCEHVYVDWEILKEDSVIMSFDFPEILHIEKIEDFGIKICGFPVPAYNEQNGYYSDELTLVLTYLGKKLLEIDITGWSKDKID